MIWDVCVVLSDVEFEWMKKFIDEVIAFEFKVVERDNECVYMECVLKFEDLFVFVVVNMVKLI